MHLWRRLDRSQNGRDIPRETLRRSISSAPQKEIYSKNSTGQSKGAQRGLHGQCCRQVCCKTKKLKMTKNLNTELMSCWNVADAFVRLNGMTKNLKWFSCLRNDVSCESDGTLGEGPSWRQLWRRGARRAILL